MARRMIALVTLLAFVGAALAQDPVELTFWSWRVEDQAAYDEIIASYEADHPNVDITYEAFPTENYNTVLSTALAADEGPDIIHVRAYGGFEAFAEPGFLMPLDDRVEALSAFPPLSLDGERLRSDGKVYAVPFASQTLVIYYNQDIFNELGLTPPTTWEDFTAAAEALEAAGYIPLANGTATGWMDEVLMGVFGPNIYGADFFGEVVSGETTFEDPRYVEALERLSDLVAYMPPDASGVDYAASQALFLNGLAGMFAGGSWEIANFRGQNPDLNLGIMAPPVEEAGQQPLVSWFLDGGYAVNAGTDHPEEALAFVRFLASPEFGQQLTDKLANISPIPGVTSSDPLLSQVVELNTNSTPYTMLVGFRYENPTGSTLLQEALQQMFAGQLSPEEVGAKVTEGIATYYEPFQK